MLFQHGYATLRVVTTQSIDLVRRSTPTCSERIKQARRIRLTAQQLADGPSASATRSAGRRSRITSRAASKDLI